MVDTSQSTAQGLNSSPSQQEPGKSSTVSPQSSSTINMANSSPTFSILKAYWIPMTLFLLSLLFQLVILPQSFPPSHYDALSIRRESSIEQVKEAYEKLSSEWDSGAELPEATEYVKIRYAFELLSNPLWKRDYDIFGIDEHIDVLEKLRLEYAGKDFRKIALPLLDVGSSDADHALNFIPFEDFQSIFRNQRPWLIQVFSHGSDSCRNFLDNWKRINALLGEVANTGIVDVGEFKLAAYFAEKKSTGQPFFRNGLPSLVAFPEGCRSSKCFVRYEGELSVDAVTDWFATTILNLPRIRYYSKDTLGPNFLARSGYHKVKVIFFSETGVRASPYIRQVAKDYQAYASFAYVLWREEEYSLWWTAFDVESAPATVFIKDPGTKPVVHYGPVNSSWFSNVMEQNKLHDLPQLRSLTSMELGCDARGYSRAGVGTMIWYCVIVIGRPSQEINQMRETIRRVQELLSSDSDLNATSVGPEASLSRAALQQKRLTFTWMDGEVQKNLCAFYLGAQVSMESCGPRRSMEDSPQVVIVRYMRNNSMDDMPVKKRTNSILDALQDEPDPAAQLVAHYNGSAEIPEIIGWISHIIRDGDSSTLPFYRVKTPDLIPESGEPLWTGSSNKLYSASKGLKQKVKGILTAVQDLLGDPRAGPMFLLGALISFGGIWLSRSQSSRLSVSSQSQPNTKREVPKEWRNRGRITPTGGIPPMTDLNPNDASEVPLSDSD